MAINNCCQHSHIRGPGDRKVPGYEVRLARFSSVHKNAVLHRPENYQSILVSIQIPRPLIRIYGNSCASLGPDDGGLMSWHLMLISFGEHAPLAETRAVTSNQGNPSENKQKKGFAWGKLSFLELEFLGNMHPPPSSSCRILVS